jgi:hypothetical protein
MFLKRSPKHATRSARSRRGGEETTRAARRVPRAPEHLRLARGFYCDALRGRQVWDTERSSHSGMLSFIVSGQRVDVSPNTPVDDTPLILSVGNPQRLAERCWDAGFSVHVDNDTAGSPAVAVIDPFGRRIDLVP